MKTMPPIEVTDAQYAYLVTLFTEVATETGKSGPAEAYVAHVVDSMIGLARRRAVAKAEAKANTELQAAVAQIDAALLSLVAVKPTPIGP